jgi:hypothetical protein
MTGAPSVELDAARAASQATIAATLRPIHSRWMGETTRGLAAALSPGANFWSGWSAVRYLHARFDWRYRWQRILLADILPMLPVGEARALRATTDSLEEVRMDLDRVGRWRNMTAVTGALAYRFLKLLHAWFVQIQRATEGMTDAELSPEGRRALTKLELTSPTPLWRR